MSSRFQIVPYSNMLMMNPEQAAAKLREVHEQKSPERWVLIEGILDMVDFHEWGVLWDAFLESGLYKVCVDILTDDASYAKDVPEIHRSRTLNLLRRHARYLYLEIANIEDKASMHAYALSLLKELPRLWEYLFTKELYLTDVMLTSTPHMGEPSDFRLSLTLTLFTMVQLHVRHIGCAPSTADNYMAHLSVYLWIHTDDDDFVDRQTLRTTVTMVDDTALHARHEVRPFFKAAVLDKGLAIPLAARFCRALLLDHHVDEDLRNIMALVSATSVHCESVLHVKLEGSPHTLVQCLRIACQRQLCLGMKNIHTGRVLAAGLSVIRDIMQDRFQADNGKLTAFCEMVHTVKILPMVARSTMFVLAQKDSELFNCLQYILDAYGVSGYVYRRTKDRDALPQFFRVTQDLWYPTVKEIREFPVPLNSQDLRQLRDKSLDTWLEFGKKLGFSERAEARKALVAEYSTKQEDTKKRHHGPGARACRWKECLCSWDAKPPHAMRVCKGCWRVWYCGRACQSMDWQNGDHREYCLSHRSK